MNVFLKIQTMPPTNSERAERWARVHDIVVIAWAIGNDEPQFLLRNPNDIDHARSMLQRFYGIIAREADEMHIPSDEITWIGHNIDAAALRPLFQASVIENVRPIFDMQNVRSVDIDTLWSGNYSRTSMITMRQQFNMTAPDIEIATDAISKLREGLVTHVAEHCAALVGEYRYLWHRMMFRSTQAATAPAEPCAKCNKHK